MLKVLMYHYIDDAIDHPMCVYEKEFYRQIRYLAEEGYRFVTIKDLDELKKQENSEEKLVMVTFDDGYFNTLERALPILNKFQAKAVMSVCSSYIREETCPKGTIHLNQHFATSNEIKRLWLVKKHEIAAHTYSHPKLTNLEQTKLELEILKDKEILEQEFGLKIESIFYPFGSVNNIVEKLVKKLYRYAFVTDAGDAFSRSNQYRIHRIWVDPEWKLNNFVNKLNMEKE